MLRLFKRKPRNPDRVKHGEYLPTAEASEMFGDTVGEWTLKCKAKISVCDPGMTVCLVVRESLTDELIKYAKEEHGDVDCRVKVIPSTSRFDMNNIMRNPFRKLFIMRP